MNSIWEFWNRVRKSAGAVSWKDTSWIRVRSQSGKVEMYWKNVGEPSVAGVLSGRLGGACNRAMEGNWINSGWTAASTGIAVSGSWVEASVGSLLNLGLLILPLAMNVWDWKWSGLSTDR
jgi:hypothetical protein